MLLLACVCGPEAASGEFCEPANGRAGLRDEGTKRVLWEESGKAVGEFAL